MEKNEVRKQVKILDELIVGYEANELKEDMAVIADYIHEAICFLKFAKENA